MKIILCLSLLFAAGCMHYVGNSNTQPLYSVSGTIVTVTNNHPIEDANIVIKTTGRGTISDAKGRFKLPMHHEKEGFVISFIGYEPIYIVLKAGTDTVIRLKEVDPKRALNQQVIHGYHF